MTIPARKHDATDDPLPAQSELKDYLDGLVTRFERPKFIDEDPISIPHGFDDPRDREVIGLYAALLAWGRRETMLKKLSELCERMEYRPSDFVRHFEPERDGQRLEGFKHRTFQPIDAFWLTKNLHSALKEYDTVEGIFAAGMEQEQGEQEREVQTDVVAGDEKAATIAGDRTAADEAVNGNTIRRVEHVGPAIQHFSETILQADPKTPRRLRKHLARPEAGSACKRLNMYLRWMVRPGPVDFGQWTAIRPEHLVLPLDVHSGRQARALGLVERKSNDWKAALALTRACRRFSPSDPARYDYAFFGTGVNDIPLDTRFTS